MKKTIVVNLFAGPGAGKSTGMAGLFYKLKLAGVDVEMVTEYAKDKVWENNKKAFKCQSLLTGKQIYRISRCYGKVDVIVTDSPICLGAIYDSDNSKGFEQHVVDQFRKFSDNGINFFINRVKPYNPNGRLQTEEESIAIDKELLEFMKKHNIQYTTIDGDDEGYTKAFNIIIDLLSKTKSDNKVD